MRDKLIVGWIDHKEAKLFWLAGEHVERVEYILSRAHGRREEVLKPEDMVERQRRGDLRRFYDEIIEAIGNEDEPVILLGHKQALHEFRNRCEENAEYLLGRLEEQHADKMTDPEIIAYGRNKANKPS